jgi:hypothetical protein
VTSGQREGTDAETGSRGDTGMIGVTSLVPHRIERSPEVPVSPCLRVSVSPCPRVSVSPCLRVSVSLPLRVSSSEGASHATATS